MKIQYLPLAGVPEGGGWKILHRPVVTPSFEGTPILHIIIVIYSKWKNVMHPVNIAVFVKFVSLSLTKAKKVSERFYAVALQQKSLKT